ncbi:MAG: filamentous hemagglutinin N-terminal domain-containing protein [Vulcanimicrobiota bacterium]
MNGRFQRTLLCGLLMGQIAWGLPEGGQVIQGGIQIGQPQNNILQILQSSPSGIINWNSFNIDQNQLVQFLQPGASSALLNRVIGQDPSQIFGQIQANGRIFLVNPNGILFGPGSSVNAGSFMATTLSIADQDFMQGRYNFQQDPGSPLRAVVNQGDIRVTEGGFIALISPVVDNQGLLLAERGQVVLGATSQASLTVDARGLLQVSIPDGFAAHSQVPGAAQTVMLTQAQMSQALSNLVTHAGNESDRIIETDQGIQLIGGEGLLVNQGTVRADGGQVLMDSSQATLNTRGSAIQAGLQGDVRVLSAGSAVQDGRLEAKTVEISGSRVGLHSTPVLGPGGRLLIDPTVVHIVETGGDGTNTINAADLDTGTANLIMADENLFVDAGVQIVLAQPTQLTLQAGNGAGLGDVTMLPGSGVTATDPGATFNVVAENTATLSNVAVPLVTVTAARTVLEGGQFGVAGSPTNVTVNSDTISISSTLNLAGTGSNVTLNGNSNVSLEAGANLVATSPANITMASPTGSAFLTGSVIAPDQTSRLQVDAANEIRLSTVSVPNMFFTTTSPTLGSVQFNTGDLGVAGKNTLVDVSSHAIPFFTGAVVNVLGQHADLNLNSSGDFGFFFQSQLLLNAPNSNLTVTSTNGGFIANEAKIHAIGSANVTFATSGAPTNFGDTSSIVVDGAGKIDLSNTDNSLNLGPNSSLTLGSGNIRLNGSQGVSLGSSSNLLTGNGNINLTSNSQEILINPGSTLRTGGGDISLSSSNSNVRVLENSHLTVNGLGNVVVNAPNGGIEFRTTSGIQATNPSDQVTLTAGADLTTAGLAASNLNLQAGGTHFFNPGVVGQAGSPTVITGNSGALFFFQGAPIQFLGSGLTWNQTATGGTILAVTSDLRFDASGPQNINWNLTGPVTAGSGASISGQSPTQLAITTSNLIGFEGTNINLPNPASRLNLQAGGVVRVNQVKAGQLDINTSGNVRLFGQVEANVVNIQTPANITNDVAISSSPAIIAHQNLNLSASQIAGPVNLPEAGLVRGFPIATDGTAIVRINVNGSNSTDLGGRAANLFYYFPQSSDIQATHPSGDVLIFNQPNPNPPPPAVSSPRVINSRTDLTSSEFAQLTGEAAQPQIQLSNLYSAALLPSTSSVLMLGYNNIGLTHYAPVPLSTPLVELAVLSPEASSNQLQARQDSSAGSDSPSTAATGTGISRTDTPTVETGVLSPEGASNRNRDDSGKTGRDDQANSQLLAGNDEDEELRYWRKLIQGFIIWEDE